VHRFPHSQAEGALTLFLQKESVRDHITMSLKISAPRFYRSMTESPNKAPEPTP
jgi:hypothetical protein